MVETDEHYYLQDEVRYLRTRAQSDAQANAELKTTNEHLKRSNAALILLLVMFTGLVILLGWVAMLAGAGGTLPIGGALP